MSSQKVPKAKKSRFLGIPKTSKVAEKVGFEPTCPFGQNDFESFSLWPLRYFSPYFTSSKNKENFWEISLGTAKNNIIKL